MLLYMEIPGRKFLQMQCFGPALIAAGNGCGGEADA